ncbi:MAG: PTS system mannose/fructose/N-acetylgalactosamine-transporter subunit IIB [Propioniciclava sp.]
MSISFIRIDDRIIHGQIIVRWSKERPCDGIIAVNDRAASDPLLKATLKAASDHRTLIFTREEFAQRMADAIASDKRYFLITKEPGTLAEILARPGFAADVSTINVGPQSARPGTINVNINADLTAADGVAFHAIAALGWPVEFQLTPDAKLVRWSDVSSKFKEA